MTRNIEINVGKGCKNYAVGEKGKLKRDLHPFWKKPHASTFLVGRVAAHIPNYGKIKIRLRK